MDGLDMKKSTQLAFSLLCKTIFSFETKSPQLLVHSVIKKHESENKLVVYQSSLTFTFAGSDPVQTF